MFQPLPGLKPHQGILPIWTNPAGIPPPVGAWMINEGSGDKIYDLSGNGNDLTLVNMEANDWIISPRGQGLHCDGVDEHIIGLNNIKGLGTSGTITVLVALFGAAGSNNGIWEITDGSTNERIVFYRTDIGLLSLYSPDNSNFWQATVFPGTLGAYQVWTVTYAFGQNCNVYLNAELVTPASSSALTAQNNLDTFMLASYDPGTPTAFFESKWIYSYIHPCILTPNQIAYLYQHPYYGWEYPEVWKYYVAAVGDLTINVSNGISVTQALD